MAASSYYATVQKAYIAFYGRPADPNGLTYWATKIDAAGGSISSIISAFGTSAEATSLYGGLSNAAAVNTLYNQIFGRDADVTGLNFYVGKLLDGSYSLVDIAQRIIDGASGTDATIVSNKLTAAQSFTDAIDTTSEVVAYSGTTAASSARTWLSTVSSTSSSLTSATSTIASTLNEISNTSGVGTGSNYTLTTGQDLLTGTTGGDVFTGPIFSTSAGDIIDGGAGTDQLKLYVNSAFSAAGMVPVVTNIEQLDLIGVAATDSATLDLAVNIAGASSITFHGSFNSSIISDIDSGVSLIMGSGVGGVLNIDRSNATADALNISFSDSASAVEIHMTALEKISALNLSFANGFVNNTADAIQVNSAVSLINLRGSGSVTLGLTVESAASALTFGASAYQGNVLVDLTYGTSVSTSANVTINLGTGSDTLRINAETASFSALVADAGSGTDKLIVDVMSGAVLGSGFFNFESVDLVAAGGSRTSLSLSAVTATWSNINLYGVSGLEVVGIDPGQTLTFLSAVSGTWALAIDTAYRTDTTADALTVRIDNTAAAGFVLETTTNQGNSVNLDVLNLNFMTAFSGGSANRFVVGSADINIIGTGSVDLGLVASAGSSINISAVGFGGNLNLILDYGTTANDVSALFGVGNDTFKLTLRNDLTAYVDGGLGTDTYDVTLFSGLTTKALKGTGIETVLVRDALSAQTGLTLDVSAIGPQTVRLLYGSNHSAYALTMAGMGSADAMIYQASGVGTSESALAVTYTVASGNNFELTLAMNSGASGDLKLSKIDVNCGSLLTLAYAASGDLNGSAIITELDVDQVSSLVIYGGTAGRLTLGQISAGSSNLDSVTINALGGSGSLVIGCANFAGASALNIVVGSSAQLSIGAISASTAGLINIGVAGSASISGLDFYQCATLNVTADGTGQALVQVNLQTHSANTSNTGNMTINLRAADTASWITFSIESGLGVTTNSADMVLYGYGSGQLTIDLRSAFTAGTAFTGARMDFSALAGAVTILGSALTSQQFNVILGAGQSTTATLAANGYSGNIVSLGAGADIIKGGSGADLIDGGAGADVLDGGDGNDIIIGGKGADVMSGGAGSDRYQFSNTTGLDQLTGLYDTIYMSTGDYIFINGMTSLIAASAGTSIGLNSGASLVIFSSDLQGLTAGTGATGGQLAIFISSGDTIIEVTIKSAVVSHTAGDNYLKIILAGVNGWTAFTSVFSITSDNSGSYITYKG